MNRSESRDRPEERSGKTALLAGGIAAMLASACCLGPLLLLALGISGVWISSLVALEPYQPLFLAVAFVALLFAARRIWRPAAEDCGSAQVCARPVVRRGYKLLFGLVAGLIVVAVGFPFVAPVFY
jgi:mercuric ion transport protein